MVRSAHNKLGIAELLSNHYQKLKTYVLFFLLDSDQPVLIYFKKSSYPSISKDVWPSIYPSFGDK